MHGPTNSAEIYSDAVDIDLVTDSNHLFLVIDVLDDRFDSTTVTKVHLCYGLGRKPPHFYPGSVAVEVKRHVGDEFPPGGRTWQIRDQTIIRQYDLNLPTWRSERTVEYGLRGT
jgi:hypothetical protein